MPTSSTESIFTVSTNFIYQNPEAGQTRTWVEGMLRVQEGEDMPTVSMVDGEITIVNPSTFESVPSLCTSKRCPRMDDCLRSIGSRDAVGAPTRERGFTSGENGCGYFLPRTTQYINQLKERGVNKLKSAWRI